VDIAKVYENAEYPTSFLANVFFRKSIKVTEDSLLHRLVGQNRTRVNSIHKQAIDKVGEDLSISAKEDNGVVQAIEDTNRPFHLGVQFHPEILIHRRPMRRIFTTLIETARLTPSG